MKTSAVDFTPFALASAALYEARDRDPDKAYKRWRELLKRFDLLRAGIDPVADQNANLDVLLRAFEDELASRLASGGNLDGDTAGLQLHIHLSRLWVFGAYEFLRTLHMYLKSKENSESECLRRTGDRGCGEAHCIVCSIGHLKNEMAVVRIGLAKKEIANHVANPPLSKAMLDDLSQEPPVQHPPYSRLLLEGEGMSDGVMVWVKYDKRVERARTFSRRYLSDKILSWAANGSGEKTDLS